MKPDEERRRNVDMALGPAQAPERSHGCEWIGNVFQHLLANHEVERSRQIFWWVAEVKLRKVQLDPARPRQVGPVKATDFRDFQGYRLQRFEDSFRVLMHDITQPLGAALPPRQPARDPGAKRIGYRDHSGALQSLTQNPTHSPPEEPLPAHPTES